MLVQRQLDTGRNTWSSSKFETIYHNAASPRMSNFEPLPPQSDWREQYSAYPHSEDNGSTFEQPPSSTVTEDIQAATRPALEHRHSLGPSPKEADPIPAILRPESAPAVGESARKTTNISSNDDHNTLIASPEPRTLAQVPDAINATMSSGIPQGTPAHEEFGEQEGDIKEEDEDLDDDDDMLDAEAEEGAAPQTAAERRAERRKMKRFRLTHQQTRFLMSEFAKQAHPDAAHRERLSREIPGLSPRQVQVWFQNRRAKIKRLTVDDRERMMKMRAVPDDFDNVQALHSPYGAVHGMNTPMQSPVDFGGVPYTEHLMRPLMVDTMRRSESEDHMSPTGLSPAFGHVGFAHSGSMGASDLLSPMSLSSSDRYYSSHPSPMSGGPRSANPFDRQSNYQSLSQPSSRQHIRPLQPLQLRETMSRTRSESLQSPLRSSMSWKGGTLDYNSYQIGQPSPALSGRQQSVYQPEQMSNGSVNAQQYDGNTSSYTNNMQTSPTHMTYPPSHGSSSLQQSSPSAMSRLRASSGATYPPSLDLRAQYRPMHNPSLNTPRSGSFASSFTGGYASAPLTAPVEFSMPRTPGVEGNRDFNIPQHSAPMAPPQDFTNAYNTPTRTQQHRNEAEYNSQSPNRGQNNGESGGQGQVQGHLSPPQQHQNQQQQQDQSYMRHREYEIGQKRKRSYTTPTSFESP